MAGPLALVWDLIAVDNASGTFDRVGVSAGGLSKAMKTASVAVAAFALTDLGVHMVKAAVQFQSDMLLIQTQAGASADEVKKMSAAVLGMAGSVGTAPDQLALSLYHVESVGLRSAAALDVVRIAAEGAKVGHADLEQTTNALTATVASGIPGVQNMSQAMGALNAVVGAGDMKMSDLNEALGSGLLTVVKGYGLSLTDVGAALATFGDNNIRGADAATMLRMAVQALAVPAAHGKGTIEGLGLTITSLAKDMQEGGLNQAIIDLKTHLDKAGISGDAVGETLTDAFGKRAGPGLAVLIGQVDRFENKLIAVNAGADGFGAAWEATTKTVSFQFDKIRAEIEAVGIKIGTAMLPYVSEVVTWLSTKIPAALLTLQHMLTPLEQELKGPLQSAFHAVFTAIDDFATALQEVGHFLDEHRAAVTLVVTAVGGMWAAYKGYQIVKAAITAIKDGFDTVALKAMYAKDAMVSAGTLSSAALGGVGIVLGIATLAWANHASQVAANKALIDSYTSALKEDSGAIGQNTAELAANTLSKSGAFDAGRKLGLDAKTLTDASLGNASALRIVNAALAANQTQIHAVSEGTHGAAINNNSLQDAIDKVRSAVGGNNADLTKAIQNYKDVAAATGQSADAMSLNVSQAALLSAQLVSQTTVIDGVTVAMSGQTTAAGSLSGALDILSGNNISAQQAQLNFKDQLASLADQIKSNAQLNKDAGTSLDENTASGRKNQEWLLSQITLVNQHADAVIKQNNSVDEATAAMQSDETALRNTAIAAGLNKDQVDALIAKYAAVPKDVKTVISADTVAATSSVNTLATSLHDVINNLDTLTVKNVHDVVNSIPVPGHASGTPSFAGGLTWINEGGPERVWLPKGTRIDPAQNSKAMPGSEGDVVTELKAQTAALTQAVGQLAQSIDQSVRSAATDGARTTAFLGGRTARVDS